MKTKNLPKQKFTVGETVWVLSEGTEREITDIKWNGFTWMYAFKETNLRCGEMYLRPIPKINSHE